jgi:hypothetical protein
VPSTRSAVWAAALCSTPPDPPRQVALARYAEGSQGAPRRTPGPDLLAASLLRAGHLEEARARLSRPEASAPRHWALLALALRRLNRPAEARAWEEKFRAHLDATFGQPEPGRIELLVLLRELDAPCAERRS